jgi:hypothetical protein
MTATCTVYISFVGTLWRAYDASFGHQRQYTFSEATVNYQEYIESIWSASNIPYSYSYPTVTISGTGYLEGGTFTLSDDGTTLTEDSTGRVYTKQ